MTFTTFKDFYPYYLGQHADARCRRLHYIGANLALGCAIPAVLLFAAVMFGIVGLSALIVVAVLAVLGLLVGYGFAFYGHTFEGNKPASFTNPWFSFRGDWQMWWDITTGRIDI